LHDEIVDAHGDQIDADGSVVLGVDGDLQLRSDAVGGGDEQRVGKAGGLGIEESAEAAERGVGPAPRGGARQGRDGFDEGVAGIDVDARVLVSPAANGTPARGSCCG
jgi:hypothetical protein